MTAVKAPRTPNDVADATTITATLGDRSVVRRHGIIHRAEPIAEP